MSSHSQRKKTSAQCTAQCVLCKVRWHCIFYDAISDTIRRRGWYRAIFTEEKVDTVTYFGGNHGFRVWKSLKLKKVYFPRSRTGWDKYMFNRIVFFKFLDRSELVQLRGKIYFTKYTMCSVGVRSANWSLGSHRVRPKVVLKWSPSDYQVAPNKSLSCPLLATKLSQVLSMYSKNGATWCIEWVPLILVKWPE